MATLADIGSSRKVVKLGAESVGGRLATQTVLRCGGHPRPLFILAVEYHCADDPNTPTHPERSGPPGRWLFRRDDAGNIATGDDAMLEITGGGGTKPASLAICGLMEMPHLERVGKHRDGSPRNKKHAAVVLRTPAKCVAHILKLLKVGSIGALLAREDFSPSITKGCRRLESMTKQAADAHAERLQGVSPVIALPRRFGISKASPTADLPLRLVNTVFFGSCSKDNPDELVRLREMLGIEEAIRITGLAASRFY